MLMVMCDAVLIVIGLFSSRHEMVALSTCLLNQHLQRPVHHYEASLGLDLFWDEGLLDGLLLRCYSSILIKRPNKVRNQKSNLPHRLV